MYNFLMEKIILYLVSWKLLTISEIQSCIVDSFLSGNTALGQATLQEANKQEQAAKEAGTGMDIKLFDLEKLE